MSRGFHLIIGSPAVTTIHLHRLLVRLAVRGRVRWLVCGNYLNLQRLIYDVALRAGNSYYDVLEHNIAISRAETCYQVVALLHKTKAAEAPTFVSDLLLHFHDEKVHDDEAAKLFTEGLQAVQQLSHVGPVIVSASGSNERPQLYASLLQNADRIAQITGGDYYGS